MLPEFLIGGITWAYVVRAAFYPGSHFLCYQPVCQDLKLPPVCARYLLHPVSIHLPNYMHAGDKMKQLALINILKDTTIAGFACNIAAGCLSSVFSARQQRLNGRGYSQKRTPRGVLFY